MQYVIIGANSNHQVQVFGTPNGIPYRSEEAATRQMKRLDNTFSELDFFVVPISHLPVVAMAAAKVMRSAR